MQQPVRFVSSQLRAVDPVDEVSGIHWCYPEVRKKKLKAFGSACLRLLLFVPKYSIDIFNLNIIQLKIK